MVTDEAVRRAVQSQVDEFIKGYTAANPKPAKAANAQYRPAEDFFDRVHFSAFAF